MVLQTKVWIIRADDWYIVGVSSAEVGLHDRKPSFLWAGSGAIRESAALGSPQPEDMSLIRTKNKVIM